MPLSLATIVVAAVLAAAPGDVPQHTLGARGLDGAAVERGLRARVGDRVDAWSITVSSRGAQRYQVELRDPSGQTDTRELELGGTTTEDRSRELASTLALIIEEHRARPGFGASAPPDGLQLFTLLEGHVGLGPPRNLDEDLGLGLAGGAWVLRDYLQPRAAVRWSHSWAGDLAVHQFSARLGLAAGAPIGDFWVGALVMPALKWTHASQIRSASAWGGGGEASLLAQYRRDWLVVGVRTGVETTFPAPRARGTEDVIRWGHLRWLLVLELGLAFPRR